MQTGFPIHGNSHDDKRKHVAFWQHPVHSRQHGLSSKCRSCGIGNAQLVPFQQVICFYHRPADLGIAFAFHCLQPVIIAGDEKHHNQKYPPAMNDLRHSMNNPKELVHFFAVHWRLWVIPALIVSLGTAIYVVFVHRNTWEASQALIIRNEAVNNDRGLGKFTQPEEMKTVQETILELARGRGVLEAALKQVGPPADYKNPKAWPTERDIQLCRKAVKILPPKGAEFGKTEVFYLTVRDHDRVRAIALNEAIFGQLGARFQQLRDAKARSIIDELSKTVALSKADLAESTGRLAATETRIGSDLAELRAMQDIGAGDSALRRSAEEIRNQLREARTNLKANEELLDVLREAQDDPGRLVAMPNRLLESQPALKRLKDGLVDAQLMTAKLLGSMSAEHPKVKAARESEEEIGRHLHNELALAIRGLEAERQLNTDRRTILEDQLAQATLRLNRLAEIRAEYETQAAENHNRTALAERAEQNLAEARAALAGAKATSLISRIDSPDTGDKPIGPSRSVIALLGIVAGLISGWAVVFLALPINSPSDIAEKKSVDADRFNRIPAYETVVTGDEHLGGNGNGRLSFRKALEKIGGHGKR
jgi:succinoglycan biosynthesis transport protein ExoP